MPSIFQKHTPYYSRGNCNGILKKPLTSLISNNSFLPILTDLYPGFLESTNSQDSITDNIGDIIAANPSLSFSLMNIIHSPFYSKKGQLSSFNDALEIVGSDITVPLVKSVFNYTLIKHESGSIKPLIHQHLLKSLKSAYLALLVSRQIGYSSPFNAYLSGLLHDIGALALINKFPLQYSQLHSDLSSGYPDLITAENQLFGVNHCQVGAFMVEGWNQLPFLSETIFYHHHPLEKVKQASTLVKLVYFSSMVEEFNEESRSRYFKIGKELLDLNENQIIESVSIAEFRSQDSLSALGISLTDDISGHMNRPDNQNNKMLLNQVNSDSLYSSLTEIVRHSENELELFKNIGKSIQLLTGISDTCCFVFNSEKQSLLARIPGEIGFLSASDDFSISIDIKESQIVTSLLMGLDTNSYNYTAQNEPALIDRQILNYLNKEGMYCFPMIHKNRFAGVIVIGINRSEVELISDSINNLRHFIDSVTPLLIKDDNADKENETVANASTSMKARKMVHEINNPLSAIKNYLKVLNMKLDDLNVESSEIKIINGEIDRVSRLLKDFAGNSSNEVNREISNINNIISDIILLLRNRFVNGTGINITLESENFIPDVFIDKDAIRQILINLIKNGIEAMPDGGNIIVKTHYKPGSILKTHNIQDSGNDGSKIAISVIDDGPGIPAHLKPKLFHEHSTTKNGHAGLGLSIVKDLIKKVGGTITFDQQDKTGTCFKILLPVNMN